MMACWTRRSCLLSHQDLATGNSFVQKPRMSLHLVANGQISFEVCRAEMSFQNKAGAPLRKASDERQFTDVQADGPADTCGARAHRHEDQATHYDDMGGRGSQESAGSQQSELRTEAVFA